MEQYPPSQGLPIEVAKAVQRNVRKQDRIKEVSVVGSVDMRSYCHQLWAKNIIDVSTQSSSCCLDQDGSPVDVWLRPAHAVS